MTGRGWGGEGKIDYRRANRRKYVNALRLGFLCPKVVSLIVLSIDHICCDTPSGREDNFQKYSHPTIDVLGTKYDYNSIMHYGRLAFSSNSEPTIKAVGNPGMELGQRDGLSEVDIIKLNALYDCKSK